MKSYDIIVIGAGHNGMAASIKLAQSGRKVLLLENSLQPGGMASSHDICDGFKSPTLAHLVNNLPSKTIHELNLTKFGLETNSHIIPSTCINSSGEYISVFNNYKSISENLDIFQQMSSEEIFEQRKNKFLKIGRNKGFISNPGNLSISENQRNGIDQFFNRNKKKFAY